MTSTRKSQARPPIQIRETDAERISNLAIEAEDRLPQVAELLHAEINRAKVVQDSRLPGDVVAMQSAVRFVDEASGVERTLQLGIVGIQDSHLFEDVIHTSDGTLRTDRCPMGEDGTLLSGQA